MPPQPMPPSRQSTHEWGWTSYKRTGWVSSAFPDHRERRQYTVCLRKIGTPDSWEQVTIQFWALRPILALRTITQGEADPLTFDDTAVN